MLKGHLLRVIYHQVYKYTKIKRSNKIRQINKSNEIRTISGGAAAEMRGVRFDLLRRLRHGPAPLSYILVHVYVYTNICYHSCTYIRTYTIIHVRISVPYATLQVRRGFAFESCPKEEGHVPIGTGVSKRLY